MKKINLHFTPKIKIIDGKNNEIEVPHIIDYTVSQYVAEQLEARTSTENPLLEYEVAQSLRNTGSAELSLEDAEYIKSIIVELPIDNMLKGQVLEVF